MHTSGPTSSFGDGASMSSTVRSCGSGMEGHQQHAFQPSANPVLAETFERHWQQLRGIAAHNVREFLILSNYKLLLHVSNDLKIAFYCILT